MSLPEEAYNNLDLSISTAGNLNERVISLERGFMAFEQDGNSISGDILIGTSLMA